MSDAMHVPSRTLSIVIPTYLREKVLVETINYLLDQARTTEGFLELILVDQTPSHAPDVEGRLAKWRDEGAIRWFRRRVPHIARSMNFGLLEARGDIVLFTDDDIIPNPDLLRNHLAAYREGSGIEAVAGQVLQPGEEPGDISFRPSRRHLTSYLDFPFRGTTGMFIENAMAGNLSVLRDKAIAVGGFDENFIPPVASRFETEFAKRLVKSGGKIWFEPKAGIRHLRFSSGGTRSRGSHLNSISPRHGVGDCYYALTQGEGFETWWYLFKRPFRQVRTKFHLKRPWWIPIKFIGELFAIAQAIRLYRQGPILISPDSRKEAPDEIA